VPLGLVSDVHGNDKAFAAVVAELARRGVEQAVCLGDVAQGGDEPAAALDRIADLGWPVVIGNADAILLDPATEPLTDEQLRRRDWSVAQLDERHLAQMRSWPLTVEVELDGGLTLRGFHASPRSYHDVLLPETPDGVVAERLGGSGVDLLAGGHTHRQWARVVDGALYVNPGSVGVSDDGLAHFAVVTGGWVQFGRVAIS
jgi:predicted phosphodiesterase